VKPRAWTTTKQHRPSARITSSAVPSATVERKRTQPYVATTTPTTARDLREHTHVSVTPLMILSGSWM
jgi:hypothetical protein